MEKTVIVPMSFILYIAHQLEVGDSVDFLFDAGGLARATRKKFTTETPLHKEVTFDTVTIVINPDLDD